jgi:hypothetical protein
MLKLSAFVPLISSTIISIMSGNFGSGVASWACFQVLYVFWLTTWAFDIEVESVAYGWYMLFSIIGSLIGYIANKYTLQHINLFDVTDQYAILVIIVLCTLQAASILLYTYFILPFNIIIFGLFFLTIWLAFGGLVYFLVSGWETSIEINALSTTEIKNRVNVFSSSQNVLGYFAWTTLLFLGYILGQFGLYLYPIFIDSNQDIYASAISVFIGAILIGVSYFVIQK